MYNLRAFYRSAPHGAIRRPLHLPRLRANGTARHSDGAQLCDDGCRKTPCVLHQRTGIARTKKQQTAHKRAWPRLFVLWRGQKEIQGDLSPRWQQNISICPPLDDQPLNRQTNHKYQHEKGVPQSTPFGPSPHGLCCGRHRLNLPQTGRDRARLPASKAVRQESPSTQKDRQDRLCDRFPRHAKC